MKSLTVENKIDARNAKGGKRVQLSASVVQVVPHGRSCVTLAKSTKVVLAASVAVELINYDLMALIKQGLYKYN